MGNKSSMTYCSMCYDVRYYSEDVMTDDVDGIVFSDMKTVDAHEELENTTRVPDKSSFDAVNPYDVQAQMVVAVTPYIPRRRSRLLNQFSFSSHHSGMSMEGRESFANMRASSTCEREDVEDDVMMCRTESGSEEFLEEALDEREPQE